MVACAKLTNKPYNKLNELLPIVYEDINKTKNISYRFVFMHN